MSRSALFVVVPEAEPWVRDLRSRYDPIAELGVPAHVSVLFPFMPRHQITDGVLALLRELFGELDAFDFTFERMARFPQTTYLIPDPLEPFSTMTAALVRAFPEYPPYGGRFAEVLPHLTVANKSEAHAAIEERELATELRRCGPIRARCRTVELFENSSDVWVPYASFARRNGT